jgi:hypothetical protein
MVGVINMEVVGGYHHHFFQKWKIFVKYTATTNSAPKQVATTMNSTHG